MQNVIIIRKPTDYGAEFAVGMTINGREYWRKKPVCVLQALLDDPRFDVDKYVRDHLPDATIHHKFA